MVLRLMEQPDRLQCGSGPPASGEVQESIFRIFSFRETQWRPPQTAICAPVSWALEMHVCVKFSTRLCLGGSVGHTCVKISTRLCLGASVGVGNVVQT